MEDIKENIKTAQITPDEIKALISALSDFAGSYEQKDEKISDSDWLLSQLTESLPDKDSGSIKQICDAIISGLNHHEEVKTSLNAAQAKGISRENWFANRMRKATAGLNEQNAAACIRGAYSALETASSELKNDIAETAGIKSVEAEVVSTPEFTPDFMNSKDWNDYTLKAASKGIVQSAGMTGLQGFVAGLASEAERQIEDGNFNAVKFIEEGLRSGGTNVKTVVAGALETAVERGALKCLPKGTSPDVVTDISHVATENIGIWYDAATGKLTPIEAASKMEDTVVGTVCGRVEGLIDKLGAAAMEWIVPILATVFGSSGAGAIVAVGQTLLSFVSPKLKQTIVQGVKGVYNYAKEKVLKPIASAVGAVWEGAKSLLSSIFSW